MTDARTKPLIVTGLSGAGMSTALKHLEDMGYEVFDNFPLKLVDALLAETASGRVAVGVDVRSRGFGAAPLLECVKKNAAFLLYLAADEGDLQRRFSETRRRHPLAKNGPVAEGIRKEKELLDPVRTAADAVIDTTGFSVHDLRRVLEGHFGAGGNAGLSVTLMSFGYRHGLPREADIVMDTRFLANPHWVAELRPLSGLDAAVAGHIANDPAFAPMLENFKSLLAPLLPLYGAEGKHYLTVAFGCTGGRHRSVCTAEKLKPWLESLGLAVHVMHRDAAR